MNALTRALLVPALVTSAMFAILVGLGTWQLRRLGEKEALIARVEQRYGETATPLPPREDWPAMRAADYDYRPVTMRGHYEGARDALIYAVAPESFGFEPGFNVVTPFRLETGAIVLVERGFLPQSKTADPARRAPPTGEMALTGRLRAPQQRGSFTPVDDPTRNIWFTRDPVAIGQALGLRDVAPFTLALDASGPVGADEPRPVAEKPSFPNNHLSYAFTWFSLALADLVIFGLYARNRWAQARAEA